MSSGFDLTGKRVAIVGSAASSGDSPSAASILSRSDSTAVTVPFSLARSNRAEA